MHWTLLLCVFKKEVRKVITYETKACKTIIDFFLIRKSERKLVRDVKVVHEECITQHELLICVLDLKEKLVRSKVKFMKRCKVWKLKEAETESIFRQRVQTRVAMSVGKPRVAEGVWKDLKECMLSEAISVCGETKGISRHKETWWWNEEVAALVQEKKRLFRLWKGLRKCKCQERCRCKKRCRCGTCKCRKKTSVFGHPQDVNADLETRKENYNPWFWLCHDRKPVIMSPISGVGSAKPLSMMLLFIPWYVFDLVNSYFTNTKADQFLGFESQGMVPYRIYSNPEKQGRIRVTIISAAENVFNLSISTLYEQWLDILATKVNKTYQINPNF